jgi:hypothetical protein
MSKVALQAMLGQIVHGLNMTFYATIVTKA